MDQIWMTAVAVIAVMALAVPFAAIVVVSIASRREEAERSLSRQAPGAVARTARRLLAFRADQLDRAQGWPGREVRFGHARRLVSDPHQYPASRQPQPRSVRADQRQGAGV